MDIKKELYEDIYQEEFSFGKNWEIFLKGMSDNRIKLAEDSLKNFTKLKNFNNKTFLDFGCGSGLFSLSAINLGAKRVVSVDIDDRCIDCAKQLRQKYNIPESKWEIKKGSALDEKFLNSLPKFDIVYSWGVLHHTGDMWRALKNILIPMEKTGLLYIAIYNNFKGLPFSSETWRRIKKFYAGSNSFVRKSFDLIWASVICTGLVINFRNPIKYIKNYDKGSVRGMSFMSNIRDWLGGYPYEFSSADDISHYFEKEGLELKNIKKTVREGCNEFLFQFK